MCSHKNEKKLNFEVRNGENLGKLIERNCWGICLRNKSVPQTVRWIWRLIWSKLLQRLWSDKTKNKVCKKRNSEIEFLEKKTKVNLTSIPQMTPTIAKMRIIPIFRSTISILAILWLWRIVISHYPQKYQFCLWNLMKNKEERWERLRETEKTKKRIKKEETSCLKLYFNGLATNLRFLKDELLTFTLDYLTNFFF